MSRMWFVTALAGLMTGLLFSSCGGGDLSDSCVECAFGGGAVWCETPGGGLQGICAPDQDLAAINCGEVGGFWAPATVCAPEDETTGDDGNNQPWQPGFDINFDTRTGEYVIDQLAFEELKLNPAPLLEDTTALNELPSGDFTVSASGELSKALGWEVGDVLLRINGRGLVGFESFVRLYEDESEANEFKLLVERNGREVALRYRIE